MKNKKLFAILTLVCFMFTLMPVAAFADPADYVVKVKVGDEAYAEDVYVTAGTTMSALAFKGDTVLGKGAYYAVNADGEAVQIKYDGTGSGVVFAFKLPGTYTIYGVEDHDKLKELVDAANDLTDGQTVANAVAKIEAQLDTKIIKSVAYVTVEAPESNYEVIVTENSGTANDNKVSVAADGGFTGNVQVTVQLKNNGKAVVGKVPTITAPDYLTVVPVSAKKVVTDATGKITYNISANRAGDFEVVFGYEDAKDVAVKVTATDGKVADVEVVKEAANPINKTPDSGVFNTGTTMKFTEANGALVSVLGKPVASGLIGTDKVKVTVLSQPATSKLTAVDFELVASKAVQGASDLVVNSKSDLKVGSYKVKLTLANGKYVTVAFEAAKMGNAVGIRFVEPATTIALNAGAPTFTVQSYDAKGVTRTLTTNDYTLSYNGKAWNGTGVINDEKYIGSTITALAKTNDDKFVATTTLEVVDSGMEVVYANTNAEVGVTTTLKAYVVDAKGNKVAVPSTNPKYVVLEKPANAYAYVATAGTISSTDKDFNVSFIGSVAGEYKIQTIFIDSNNVFVTGIETITVSNNKTTFKDVVVMSIGSGKIVVNSDVKAIDAAPMIKDARTFVPFRALAEAFGATVAYDEATQSVTAELNGVKVVMTIGSTTYTVNGVEKTADVAPFINGSRTMVPVRFVAEAFGITVTPIAAEDGSVADVLFAK